MTPNPDDWTDEDHQKKVATRIACQMLGHHIINKWSYVEVMRPDHLQVWRRRGLCERCHKMVDVDG